MKREFKTLLYKDWEYEEIRRNLPEKDIGKLIVYMLHKDLELFFQKMSYTDEEIDIAVDILHEMEWNGEALKITMMLWKKFLGDPEEDKKIDLNDENFIKFIVHFCENMKREIHKRTLKYLQKKSH